MRSARRYTKKHSFDIDYLFNEAKYDEFVRYKSCESKVRFPDEMHAIHACLGHSVEHGGCRYYRCPYCKGYHITSQVEDLSKAC